MTWLDDQDQTKIEEQLANLAKCRDNPKYKDVFAYSGGDDRCALWLVHVDAHAQKNIGLSIFDLADYCWADDFEAGMSPAESLSCALEGEFG